MDQLDPPKIFILAQKYFSTQSTADICKISTSRQLFGMFMEIFLLIALSHIFHMFLRRLGQPSVVSQMLVGIFIGPSVLGHFNLLNKDKSQISALATTARIFFMFLVGLEIDITFVQHKFRTAATISVGNGIACASISIFLGPLLHLLIRNTSKVHLFTITLFLVLFNTASPILIRIISELKLTMTEIGKVAVSTAIVNDTVCLLILAVLGLGGMRKMSFGNMLPMGLLSLVMFMGALYMLRLIVIQVNKKNDYRKEVRDDVLCSLLLIVLVTATVIETIGYDPMMPSLLMGLVIPRNGPTSRTLVKRLTYVVNNFILPLYFGDAGLQTDLGMLINKEVLITVAMVVVLGTIGKVGGTIAGANYLGIQMREGLILGLLLNVKGHIDLLIVSYGKKFGIWDNKAYMALLITVLFNSIIAGPVAAYVVRRERKAIQYTYKGLEWLSLNSELCILACVHSPHDVATMLDLIEISNGYSEPNQQSNFIPYIFNLIELTSSVKNNTMLYHQLQDRNYSTDVGHSQARHISRLVDKFVRESNINVHELTAISCYDTMHEDLNHGVQDVHASLVIVPFHRRRRLDGKMAIGKEDIRQFNINVLHHTQCSVGILVDRGMDKESNIVPSSMSSDDKALIPVVVLFLGGPDDREAASYAMRLALHPCVSVTIVRFLPTFKQGSGVYARESTASCESGSMLMDMEGDVDQDELFVSNFFNKFVVTNKITYEERRVGSSTELIKELSSMQGIYSLYLVGRQIQGPAAHLTAGMSSWEECPELGSIGDLLASSDFMFNGTILVIRQHEVATAKVA